MAQSMSRYLNLSSLKSWKFRVEINLTVQNISKFVRTKRFACIKLFVRVTSFVRAKMFIRTKVCCVPRGARRAPIYTDGKIGAKAL